MRDGGNMKARRGSGQKEEKKAGPKFERRGEERRGRNGAVCEFVSLSRWAGKYMSRR